MFHKHITEKEEEITIFEKQSGHDKETIFIHLEMRNKSNERESTNIMNLVQYT